MEEITTWDALLSALAADGAPTFEIPEDWCYSGANPLELRSFMEKELEKMDPKPAATALLRSSILIQVLGTRKSVKRAMKANEFQASAVEKLPGHSLNAAGSALPELGLVFMTSSASKPTPSLQQLNLRDEKKKFCLGCFFCQWPYLEAVSCFYISFWRPRQSKKNVTS